MATARDRKLLAELIQPACNALCWGRVHTCSSARAMHRIILGLLIQYRREDKGLSQGNLAAQVGLDQSALSRVEHGVHTVSSFLLEKVEKALETESLLQEIDEVFVESMTAYNVLTEYRTFPSLKREDPDDLWWSTVASSIGLSGLTALLTLTVKSVIAEKA